MPAERDLVRGSLAASAWRFGFPLATAMAFLDTEHGWRVEGGGAVGVAAVLESLLPLDGPTAIVVSGGNVADETFRRAVGAVRRGR